MQSHSHKHRGHDHGHGDSDARRFVHRMFGTDGPRGGPRHERGPHGHGGRGRLGRLFEHGDLRFVILSLIAEKPRHGYEVIKAIEEKVAGAYAPSPGVVYPTLTMLEELGYATVANAEAGKKLYAVTEEGRAHLAANQPAVAAIFARMTEASEAMGGGLSPQILRAMENLRFALKLRLTRGPLGEDQVQRIVAVLDDAARAIEQI
jgi:DNA-binding PadR family transcriptional regulator